MSVCELIQTLMRSVKGTNCKNKKNRLYKSKGHNPGPYSAAKDHYSRTYPYVLTLFVVTLTVFEITEKQLMRIIPNILKFADTDIKHTKHKTLLSNSLCMPSPY